jgi:Mg2+ and Co2+ transporter CorA
MIQRFEKQKKDIGKKDKKNLDKAYEKLDSYNNIINHYKSRIERLLAKYQEE